MWRITLFLREEKDNKNKTTYQGEIQHMMSTSSVQTASQFLVVEEFLNNFGQSPDFSKVKKNYERYGATP
jgi:hypothetical protein